MYGLPKGLVTVALGHITEGFYDTASLRSQKCSQHGAVYQKGITLPKRRCPRRCKPERDNGASEICKPSDAPRTKPRPCVKTMLCAIVQREAVNPRVGNLVHRVATVKFRPLHKVTVITELSKNAFHFTVVRLRQMRVVFDVHDAESRARRPDHATFVALVVDGREYELGIEICGVSHGRRDS